MLKKRDIADCHVLFPMMIEPSIYPYVRQKANSYDEFIFLTKQIMEEEEKGNLISRTILDEWANPIGTINLFDIVDNQGFLGTWIGKDYHSKGYNQHAKELFFDELFYHLGIQTIYMKIRKINIRSQKAAEKLSYVLKLTEQLPSIYDELNSLRDTYYFYQIPKDLYTLWKSRDKNSDNATELKEA